MLLTRNVGKALTFVLLLSACSTRSDQAAPLPDDLKQDLAAAASSSGDLATPQQYQPMRFVSAVERAHSATPTRRPAVAHRRVKATHARRPAPEVASETPDPASTMVAEAPAPVAAPEAPRSEPTVITHEPSEPANAPSPATTGAGGEVGGGARGHGGGWGGILGGLIGTAVIRGGIGGVDKCDPRGEGRRRPTVVVDRPIFGMPFPGGQTTFPRMPRR